jgi:hypothetical protein
LTTIVTTIVTTITASASASATLSNWSGRNEVGQAGNGDDGKELHFYE